MAKVVTGLNQVDFFYRYRRFAWKEQYLDGAEGDLGSTLIKAQTLAPFRIQLFAFTGQIESSPYLAQIVVSNDAVDRDSLEDTQFATKTGQYDQTFVDEEPADPRFVLNWRTSNATGFGRTRYLSGISTGLISSTVPQRHPTFLPLFQKFAKALSDGGWAYRIQGSGPLGNPDNPVSFIQFAAGTLVRVWAQLLPPANATVELRYGRFEPKTPPIRGRYKVQSVGAGFFEIDAGQDAPLVEMTSPGIWRLPKARAIPYDGTSLLIGLGVHARGFKEHAPKGRVRRPRNLVF